MAGFPSEQLSQLSSQPAPQSPGGGTLIQMLLTFLAGAGFDKVAGSVKGLMGGAGNKGSKGGDMDRPHRGGIKIQADPSNPGGVGATPSAQQQGQQGAPGGMDPQMIQKLLAMLAQMQGQGGGGGQSPPQQ